MPRTHVIATGVFFALSLPLFLGCSPRPVDLPDHPLQAERWKKIVARSGSETWVPVIPPGFPEYPRTEKAKLTKDSIELGRWLFYDKRLSRDDSVACANCHQQQFSFSDNRPFSTGVRGQTTERNSMPLVNLVWDQKFFWDGRAPTLEQAVLMPVTNSREMDMQLPDLAAKLQRIAFYRDLFRRVFGSAEIDQERIARALSAFLRSLISRESGIDQIRSVQAGGANPAQVPAHVKKFLEQKPEAEINVIQHACASCHESARFGQNRFENIGLPAKTPENQTGKFKTPSLYNVGYTAPYMHDGSVANSEKVIAHYDSGIIFNTALAPELSSGGRGKKFQFTARQRVAIAAFLNLFNDEKFVSNPLFADPFAAAARFGDP